VLIVRVRQKYTKFVSRKNCSFEKLSPSLIQEDITFEAETCLPDATISITNTLPIDIKYVGYYCNINVLVPPDYIVPSTYIEDLNGFSTQVRFVYYMHIYVYVCSQCTRVRSRSRAHACMHACCCVTAV